MAVAYTPPGVSAQEITSTTVSPQLAIPGSIYLVGMSAGGITQTDTITLTGTTATALPGCPLNATMATGASSIVLVMDATQPSIAPGGYVLTTDFTFTAPTGNGAAWTPPTIARTMGSAIPTGNSVYVTYIYLPADYFQPIRLASISDIETRFGPSWNAAGTGINSRLSHAALIAFQNGASSVVLQPLYFNTSGVLTQPTSSQAATASTWATVFNGLLSQQDMNILVPVVGQSDPNMSDAVQLQIFEAAQDYIYQMNTSESQYVEAVLGEDSSGSNSVAQDTTLLTHAQTLIPRYAAAVTEQLVFVNTSQFSRSTNAGSGTFLVGGQYVAAAVAGMLASRNAAAPLTRQAISGFVAVTDTRTTAAMNNDAANGMLVVRNQGTVVQIRHGITMDNTTVATRELNVVRAKQYIIESVMTTLDTQVIGIVVADSDAPTLVNNVVIGILEELRGLGYFVDYTGVQSTITSTDPTTMLVQFSYLPSFIINYIQIQYSLDLSTQSITVSSNGTSA